MVIPGTLFEELGFNYIGPIDGHDIKALVKTLKNMRQLKGPQLLHVMTKKARVMTRPKKTLSVITVCRNLTPKMIVCRKAKAANRPSQTFLGNGYVIPRQ